MRKLISSLFTLMLLVSAQVSAGPVDINSADAASLAEAITGIGDQKARAIVEYRDTNGPFASVEDLMNVKGVGSRTIEKNRHNLTVGGGVAQ